MTTADIAKIEAALGLSLPGHYKEFITTHMDEYKIIAETLARNDVTYISVPWDDADEMIQNHLDFAKAVADYGDQMISSASDFLQMVQREQKTVARFAGIVIGTNGGGNFCMIKQDGSDPGVYWWHHESAEIEKTNDSLLSAFAEDRAILERHS